MQREFARFVEEPTRANYLAARAALLAKSPIPVDATDLAHLGAMLDAGEYDEALARLELLPPSAAISPRVHFLAAEAAEATGDDENVELERYLFVICLQAMLATGSGTSAEPYQVCHPSDEYDLLEVLELTPAAQRLEEYEGRLFDVLLCTTGREVWFDMSHRLGLPGSKKRMTTPPRRRARVRVVRPDAGHRRGASTAVKSPRTAKTARKTSVSPRKRVTRLEHDDA
ncbi:hypothetical protein Psta_3035 [Pirellula staleyi DSM 6068]|uniref:DUF4919 domain-containing protein n=1 Tax=Pirellula staleyi (strain ATCC 27377 / DSM 6068 / ICPB 4128) TaxID=530564 RepID=D2R9F0_PIRSD|nr:DUF4919 domain-containing protein [Pirellula staleyi]ADB17700.1 hypothetical protein Psta_3035 [Pirellula staleyi DSM 6068]